MKWIQIIVSLLMTFFFFQKMYGQDNGLPHLTLQMVDEDGVILLNHKEAWRFQPGDDLHRADPAFDDAGWYHIVPDRLRADAVPDSLWKGYGWWRFAFTADSAVCAQITRLYFYSWGAAEVYLDGRKIKSYGTFSMQSADEKNYIPPYAPDSNIQIARDSQHVLAIRFSNHQAKRNAALLRQNAQFLGFSIGLANEIRGHYSDRRFAYSLAAFSMIAAILSLLLLLQLLLFFKLPRYSANLMIVLVIASFLIAGVSIYSNLFMQLDGFWNSIIGGYINTTAFAMGLALLPYTLALIFRLAQFDWTKHIAWLIILRTLNYHFLMIPIVLFDPVLIFAMLFLIGVLMYRAIKSDKQGVFYVMIGAIGTTVFLLINRLHYEGVINLTYGFLNIDIVLLYISFPVGLYVYLTSRYATLFSAMEKEVAERTFELNKSLEELKATQTQLIQSEKLASLGELTAGIAHEIQNPLNFVNNFSELGVDLAEELKLEIGKLEMPAKDKDYVGEIVNDLAQNQEKINHHGKRASSIVKGMLEHSRTSTGVKEPTDINALADEYLRLAYHGLRAKDSSFNADFKTNFDKNLPKIEVIPQDMGRVLLNLVNNAFYAVADRRRLLLLTLPGFQTPAALEEEVADAYKPTVTVSTKKAGDKIEIRVADNGNGIPKEIKDKIFQPFFTTKPTGQGTGLGLSLAHDIVTKGHGGTLEVETEEGVGTTFILKLAF